MKLEQAEKDIAYRLDTFAPEYESSLNSMVSSAKEKIDGEFKFFEENSKWKEDKKVQPYVLAKDRIEDISALIAIVAMVKPNAPETTALKDQYKQLVNLNEERRKVPNRKNLYET